VAKNRNNKPKNKTTNKSKNTNNTQMRDSVKNSHAEVPDNSPGRSGPGGD